MSSIFILGLEDSYTKEKLFQIRPTGDNSTVAFDVLVKAASEIQQAKDNCQESGSSSVNQVSGGEKSKKEKECFNCCTTSHNEQGFSREVRKKLCKAFDATRGKCKKVGHFPKGCRVKSQKTAKVKVVSAEPPAAAVDSPVVATAQAAAQDTQAAALNSVQAYTFDSARYRDDFGASGSYWSVSASIPIQTQRLWCKMEASTACQPLGHYVYDNMRGSWKRAPPPGHAAKKVQIELDRKSYEGHPRTKGMRKPIFGWAFPDSGAQVTLINPFKRWAGQT